MPRIPQIDNVIRLMAGDDLQKVFNEAAVGINDCHSLPDRKSP